MPEISGIAEGGRYEAEFEGLRLVVERRPDYWQLFVYDVENCEVLLTAQRPTGNAAQLAALEIALIHTFGPKHDLKIPSARGDVIVAIMLK